MIFKKLRGRENVSKNCAASHFANVCSWSILHDRGDEKCYQYGNAKKI